LEEFGASGLAWGRIVEGIIVEELWKHLVNAANYAHFFIVMSGLVYMDSRERANVFFTVFYFVLQAKDS
jgi:hypothetical protein